VRKRPFQTGSDDAPTLNFISQPIFSNDFSPWFLYEKKSRRRPGNEAGRVKRRVQFWFSSDSCNEVTNDEIVYFNYSPPTVSSR